MNEGRQITEEQAEACMRADSQFQMKGNCSGWYFMKDGVTYHNLYKEFTGLIKAMSQDGRGWDVLCTIHADPNNTFERLFGSGELTFEEVGAALFRGEIVKVDFGVCDALIRVVVERGQLEIHESDDGGKTWGVGFLPDEPWKYTLYKEPTHQPEPTTEPLTLEALEARVKALEARP